MNPAPAALPRRRLTSLLSLAATSAALAPQAAEAAPGDPVGPPVTVATGVVASHVARAGNGRMVASYLAGPVLKARRYAADGSAEGAPITVAGATGTSLVPGGASMDADGDFVVAWAEVVDRRWQLNARRYDADGTPRDGVIDIGSTPASDPALGALLSLRRGLTRLTVDMNPDGDFDVLWSDYQTTFVGSRIACKYLIGAVCAGDVRETLRVRRYDRSGQPKGLAQVVASVSENSLDVGGVTGLTGGRILGGADVESRADGSAVVAWSTHGQVGEQERGRLYARHYGAGGFAGLPRQIGPATGVFRADVRLDSAADGSYAIVHRTIDVDPDSFALDCGVDRDLLAADGTPLQPRTRVDLPSQDFDCLPAPDVAMDAAGNHVVAFRENDGIKARRYAAGGTALGGLFDLTPPATVARGPVLATGSGMSGEFVVGYVGFDARFVLQRHEGP